MFRGILASIHMNRLWSFPEPIQLEGALAISRQLDLAPSLACILAKIGLVEERQARDFLSPRLRDLPQSPAGANQELPVTWSSYCSARSSTSV